MAHSLLEGKRFFCREWAFSKINHCLEHRASAKTCGALIMGGPGCGKTALCCEVIWPTCQGRQQSLNKRVLAYHFCQAHDTETLSLTNFIQSLSAQLIKSKLITGYAEKVQDPAIQAVLSTEECKRNPDIAFKKGVLLPLLTLHPPTHNLFCLIDSIDESYLYTVSKTEGTSTTIAELLAAHHHIFPPWLLLVCSARKQSKTVTRLFTGFRKISLDDLRKSHVVRDVQQYILCRLDQEAALRQHLSRETAEMLNQLHIKSNGCFLYLAKVLDGVADNFITLKDIREIPGTLNGLYLWLCQRLFVRKQFVRIQPILNVILAARKPLTPEELYQCVWTKGSNMNFQDFTRDLGILSNILTDGPCGTKILFHHSFAEWLLDVKHCTQKYLCSATDGHGMLAMRYTTRAQKLGPSEVQDFALHLSKIGPQSTLEHYHQVVWLIQSGAPVEASLLPGLPKDDAVTKLLLDAGAHLPTVEDKSAEVEKERRDSIARLLANDSAINELDKHGRTLLCNASYQGNLELVNILIVRKAELETSDKNGQTAMNLSAKQGHTDVTRALIGAGVNVDHADSDGWTPLRSASWSGHVDVVALLLEAGAAVDNPDSDNRTALRAAAWSGHSDIVLLLLQYGANVNIVDNEGRTALIAAAYMGHNGIVSHLLDHGANINHEDCDGRTALSVSALCVPASEGHSAVISHLLDRGAAVDHRDHDGMTPLLVASYEGHHRVCELLLEGDADVDGADKNGRTPLLAAASMGHVEIVDLLLFWCAAVDSIDSDGRTVLSIAAGQGHPIIVQKLLDRGLDDMHRDNAGLTPLHMSAFEGHTQVSEQLLNIGAHVDEVDNDGRHALILASQEGHVQMVASLLDAGANIDRRAHNGKTALRVASLEGHKEVVNLLVGRGCDLNYKDADGRSTIYMLALENSVEIAAFLLENGGDMEAVDLEGRTALHVASWQGHHDFCQLLLRHGAQVNALDNENRSPLQSASWQGHANIVTLLLEHGAIVDHMCNQGATALCISAQEGHEDVVKALLQFGADASRSDLYGRTAMRVAVKGNHASLIAILEQYGASNSGGRASTSSGSSGNSTMGKPPINPCNLIIQGAGTGSPSETPESTMDRRKSSLSNNSSGNLTSSNCSTNQSSGSSGPREEPAVLTFTQQIQQSMSNRNQSKVTNKMLSPVNEPVSPIQSVVSSPRQDQPPTPPHSKIPVKKSISSPPSNGTRPATKKSQRSNSINIITNPTCELQDNDGDYEDDDDDDDIWQPRQSSLKNGNLRKNNSQLKTGIPVSQPKKNSLTKCVETENLQNRLAHFKNNNISGKTSGNPPLLKSPEPRRQRSGIKTNPKFTKVNAVNGYYGNLTSVPVTEKATVSTNGKIVTAAVRPGGLPLKKETPL